MDVGKMRIKTKIKDATVTLNGYSVTIEGIDTYKINYCQSDSYEFLYADYSNGWFRKKEAGEDGTHEEPIAIPIHMLEEAFVEPVDETPGTE